MNNTFAFANNPIGPLEFKLKIQVLPSHSKWGL